MQPQGPVTSALEVLVVEDEFLIAMDLRSLLQDAGYEVMGPVPTVAAALDMLACHRPDACILDVNLRGEHCAPVALALRAQNIPLLLSSAYEQASLVQNSELTDVVNIGKPALPERLFSTLAALLKT